jgi:hypothetical protein
MRSFPGIGAMSEAIEKLLIRNLHQVFGERDSNRRRTAIAQIYTDGLPSRL